MDGMVNTSSLKLQTSDGKTFEWSIGAVKFCKYLVNILEDSDDVTIIPLPSINSDTLEKVQKYCEYHQDDSEDDLPQKKAERADWDMNYLRTISKEDINRIILAGLELDNEDLMRACCKVVLENIKGKSVEEMREYLNIENDLTPEETQQIRTENQWIHPRD